MHANGKQPTSKKNEAPEVEDFSFFDLIDVINPLQHIPIISSVYRAITGDEIRPEARIVGGTLLAGPVGLVVGVVNSIMEDATGKDVGENVIALFNDEDTPADTQLAQQETQEILPWLQDGFDAAQPSEENQEMATIHLASLRP